MLFAHKTRNPETGPDFEYYRQLIVGNDKFFTTPFGEKPLIYADWVASGRLFRPIEDRIVQDFGPFVGNTHTETSVTGTTMTMAYHMAREIIKKHVNAGKNDCLIAYGSGMTAVVNKLQRILGLRLPERLMRTVKIPENERPIVFVTHMEHHSNHTSWLETIADVECIEANDEGLVNLNHLEILLETYKDRTLKIASVTACSNVTGIFTPYHKIAGMMHENGGLCFVDFACSAPYAHMNMHPENPLEKLDAIYFSPHKFLGGPGSPGILIFDMSLYKNTVPDNPGGGTVKWTNPWNEYHYIENIEDREDGGTPPFLQTIKAALCVRLKEQMGVENIMNREHEIVGEAFSRLEKIKGLNILAGNIRERLGVISFYIDGLHYNLGVKLLNDRYGIQVRGGCSCAGTYGHYLLNVSREYSRNITDEIDHGNLSHKPGWIRLSLHPTMSNDTVDYILNAIEEMSENFHAWSQDYDYHSDSNEYKYKNADEREIKTVENWFTAPL